MTYYKHETAVVDDGAEIGEGTSVWHYTHVCSGAKIGKGCTLGQNVYVGPGVIIGDGVKIQNNVSVYEGVVVEDEVFLGPSCVLTNDKNPSATGDWTLTKTLLKKGSSVGANATIVCGVTIGEGALIGAGAVVTKDVPPRTTVVGNPARELISKKSVGVIGCGTVGGAIISALEKSGKYEILKNDKYKVGDEYLPISDLRNCDLVFISVPTPYSEELGCVDLSPVMISATELGDSGFSGVLVLKSTVPPGTSRRIQELYPKMSVVFNPEFLRENTAVQDFYNQKYIILGVSSFTDSFSIVTEVFEKIVNNFTPNMIDYTTYETAEIVKYAQNVMFASRIAICNVIYDACQKYEVEYEVVKELAFYQEPQIGSKVVEVPGKDGLRGFGGKCLPKDLAGFNGFYEHEILKAIIEYNKSLGREIE